ncbi:hypothetical protein [Anabaena lutea]|nr:hypothetical protein [Anabaena lutea]
MNHEGAKEAKEEFCFTQRRKGAKAQRRSLVLSAWELIPSLIAEVG